MSLPHSHGSIRYVQRRRTLLSISPVIVTVLLCALLFGALGQAMAAPSFQKNTHTISINVVQRRWPSTVASIQLR